MVVNQGANAATHSIVNRLLREGITPEQLVHVKAMDPVLVLAQRYPRTQKPGEQPSQHFPLAADRRARADGKIIYDVPRRCGTNTNDVTDFHPANAEYHRKNLPEIMYQPKQLPIDEIPQPRHLRENKEPTRRPASLRLGDNTTPDRVKLGGVMGGRSSKSRNHRRARWEAYSTHSGNDSCNSTRGLTPGLIDPSQPKTDANWVKYPEEIARPANPRRATRPVRFVHSQIGQSIQILVAPANSQNHLTQTNQTRADPATRAQTHVFTDLNSSHSSLSNHSGQAQVANGKGRAEDVEIEEFAGEPFDMDVDEAGVGLEESYHPSDGHTPFSHIQFNEPGDQPSTTFSTEPLAPYRFGTPEIEEILNYPNFDRSRFEVVDFDPYVVCTVCGGYDIHVRDCPGDPQSHNYIPRCFQCDNILPFHEPDCFVVLSGAGNPEGIQGMDVGRDIEQAGFQDENGGEFSTFPSRVDDIDHLFNGVAEEVDEIDQNSENHGFWQP
ncbi:hypothetical protein EJ08DRAFT_657286 [Tothia fuscella]|uniref:Uncharacterized protein n=1 Tax=Tothia fuscella TaxID=1048955 RepID=A0A9P4U282_9PEZI|nr:hypothetical protein EJ08DRAFT_657286 [Tothia fuscella]